MNQKKVIGILGGMGPQASVKLYELIIEKNKKYSPSMLDEDFPEVLIDSVPVPNFISDRKNFEKAKQILQNRTVKLESFGATILTIACNTAHLLIEELKDVTSVPFISIVESVRDYCIEKKFTKVGLFGSPTTLNSNMYNSILKNIKVVRPDKSIQKAIEQYIYKQINNAITYEDKDQFTKLSKRFVIDNKLDALILGCTELPLIYKSNIEIEVIDTLDLLADKLLDYYYN